MLVKTLEYNKKRLTDIEGSTQLLSQRHILVAHQIKVFQLTNRENRDQELEQQS